MSSGVHHGGVLMEQHYAGLPSVVVLAFADQPFWGSECSSSVLAPNLSGPSSSPTISWLCHSTHGQQRGTLSRRSRRANSLENGGCVRWSRQCTHIAEWASWMPDGRLPSVWGFIFL